ncbi:MULTISPECIES: dipicolinate synthase subunit DpsA [Paenibacillus]|uniref:Dihydrofolate reductase n=1 Tax=Paenibacillus naphthalenovorans TaxID=162209 RepID=A0A0U2U5J3_9BACL|nr:MULTISPECIES: dipicolinate synthase subunit DpsA [Paenibacillus]ALS21689.1 dihydrofolate reductase [Paenibacillus naphthalenovorans]NTZ16438.1 dipicolinate synthase subunit DpsA [Paenibacillus sp. JMULE4]GCL71418.1 dipicolinate synthase subunit A [Paenibacillus naphthalenovorans]SDI88748.1 dipicolinate synthase subunit A [Paenibacillus naphthalenovorans]
MLTGIHVALIGGDARQLEVIHKCSELDATVVLIGFDNLQNGFSGITKAELTPEVLEGMDAVILPAVGTDDYGHVESLFASKELRIEGKHIAALPKKAKVFAGMAKTYLRELCTKEGIELIELFDRDDVAIYNSIPTAEGAIMMAIQNTDITLHGSESMVLGFGRTGITVARTLQGMGARVRVGVNKPEYYARALEMGMNPFYTKDLITNVSHVDLLFNTIPSMIITAQIIANIPHRAVIIDLASKPGGTDFRFAEKRGIKAILAPGLPGIVAPKTAGRIIGDTITRIIMEDANSRRNR